VDEARRRQVAGPPADHLPWRRDEPTHIGGTLQRLGPDYGRLWRAAALSNLGDGILLVGGPLVAIQLTRSATLVAGALVALSLPWLLLSLPAGALADRYDRRGVLLTTTVLRVGIVVLAGSTALTGSFSLPALYLTLFLVGACEVLFDTTSTSLVPSLVERGHLSRANGRLTAAQMVGNQFAGAPLAGLLVSVAVAWVFFGPAVLFVLAIPALRRVPRGAPITGRGDATLRADIREGLAELRARPVLVRLAALAAVVNIASGAFHGVFVLFVVGPGSPMGLSEIGYGMLAALLAAGSVLGSLVVGPLESWLGPSRLMVGALLLVAAALTVPIVSTGVAPVAAMLVALGFAITLLNVVVISSRQRIIPDRMLGRVNAAYQLIGQGAGPVGALAGGLLADLTTLPAVFLMASALVLGGALLLGLPLRDRDLAPLVA
jgi:MFS family permease